MLKPAGWSRALQRLRAAGRALWARRDALPLVLAVLLVAATFLRPSLPVQRPRLELVVAIDVTQSMNVPDGDPASGRPVTRGAAATAALERLVPSLPCGSKLGWAAFTEHRSLLLLAPIEVCEHQRELLATLRHIDGRIAWEGNSEVAKGINSGMQIAQALPGRPALVFVTDGHEAPPVNPNYRPGFAVERGEVRGLIVGVGGETPLPIPKVDPSGHALGSWGAEEVLQVDPRSLGRGGSLSGEQMVETEERRAPPLPGATPGSEHLSALREGYLRLLASETGLGYLRLDSPQALAEAFDTRATVRRLARPAPAEWDLRPALALAAAALLLWPQLTAVLGRRPTRKRVTGVQTGRAAGPVRV